MAILPDRTELTTPADGDLYVTTDVSDTTDAVTGTDKKITWANVKAALKTYFDTLYAGALGADDNYVTDAEKAALHAYQTSIVGITGTKAQFDTAVTDGNFMYVGDAPTAHTHLLAAGATDVTATAAEVNILDGVTATTAELNHVDGVTSAIQTQLDAKLATTAYDDATAAEVNTGTSTAKYVSPDSLAGSYAGTKSVSIQVYDGATDVATGDGKAYITIPEALNGMNLIRAQATVVTAGTTNATTVMIHNKTDATDMLSGAISIASAGTVGTVGTVNGATDDVATNDVLRIDVDSVSTTAPQGLQVVLEFRLP